ncbi:MAG: phospholipase [Bacteroidales bacterium]|nr:phospholipase [Bacteroidales bacterium]
MTIVLLIIILLLTVAGVFIIRRGKPEPEQQPRHQRTDPPPAQCCGAHEVCEAETLLSTTTDIVYYSDEEIDRFAGMAPDDYSSAEVDELRDILLTLRDYEVAGWLRSLNLRHINLPDIIREEALMLVSEYRQKRHSQNANNSI